ncbi:MAG: hypothetical protein AAGF76_06515 [Pseudomonadota bacterium]
MTKQKEGEVIGLDVAWLVPVAGWTARERSALEALQTSLDVPGRQLEWSSGTTDCGDPWIVAIDVETEETALHVARIGRTYVALDGSFSAVATGHGMRHVLEACVHAVRPASLQSDGDRSARQQGMKLLPPTLDGAPLTDLSEIADLPSAMPRVAAEPIPGEGVFEFREARNAAPREAAALDEAQSAWHRSEAGEPVTTPEDEGIRAREPAQATAEETPHQALNLHALQGRDDPTPEPDPTEPVSLPTPPLLEVASRDDVEPAPDAASPLPPTPTSTPADYTPSDTVIHVRFGKRPDQGSDTDPSPFDQGISGATAITEDGASDGFLVVPGLDAPGDQTLYLELAGASAESFANVLKDAVADQFDFSISPAAEVIVIDIDFDPLSHFPAGSDMVDFSPLEALDTPLSDPTIGLGGDDVLFFT